MYFLGLFRATVMCNDAATKLFWLVNKHPRSPCDLGMHSLDVSRRYKIISQMNALSSYHSGLSGAPRDWTLKALNNAGEGGAFRVGF